MRNLKRVLSLTLASVMLLGMMVVGAGAAAQYSDVDYSVANVEAIEVLNALDIMTGDEGTDEFRPDDEVSRAEMARIMACMLGLNYAYYNGTHPFTDMVGHWAEDYVAACAASGVIAGRTTTTYDPDAGVTAVEASAMMMRALGYFKYPATDYVGGFEVATVAQGTKIGIYDGIDGSAYAPMTRNQVAQLTLNTLKSSMVEVSSPGTTITTPDGTVINTGAATYTVRTVTGNANSRYAAISSAGSSSGGGGVNNGRILTVELGEELYGGDLILSQTSADDFDRPADQWRYKGIVIGTYAHEPTLVYTKGVKGVDVWTDLGKPNMSQIASVYYTIDGDTTPNKKDLMLGSDGHVIPSPSYGVGPAGDQSLTFTGNGVLTEVYYNANTNEIQIIAVNSWLAEVTGSYDANSGKLPIRVLGTGHMQNATFESELSDKDFAISGYSAGDYLVVTGYAANATNYKIASVEAAAEVEGVVSQHRRNDYVTVDGTNYSYSNTGKSDRLSEGWGFMNTNGTDVYDLQGSKYTLYLDSYGYVLGVKGSGGAVGLTNVLFIHAVNNQPVGMQARVTFLDDGTSRTITIDKHAGKGNSLVAVTKAEFEGGKNGAEVSVTDGTVIPGRFYTFSTNKDGSYNINDAGPGQGWLWGGNHTVAYQINPDADDITHPIYAVGLNPANDDGTDEGLALPPVTGKTVFVADATGTDVFSVGLSNIPKVSNTSNPAAVYYLLDNDAFARSTYVKAVVTAARGSLSGAGADYIYVYGGGAGASGTATGGKDNDGNEYYIVDAVVGTGVEKNIIVSKSGGIEVIPGLYQADQWVGDIPYLNDGVTADPTDDNYKWSDEIYAYTIKADTSVSYMDNVLGFWTDDGNTYYVLSADTRITIVYAGSTSGGSVSSARQGALTEIPGIINEVKNGTQYNYDIYLVKDKVGSTKITQAFFVRKPAS